MHYSIPECDSMIVHCMIMHEACLGIAMNASKDDGGPRSALQRPPPRRRPWSIAAFSAPFPVTPAGVTGIWRSKSGSQKWNPNGAHFGIAFGVHFWALFRMHFRSPFGRKRRDAPGLAAWEGSSWAPLLGSLFGPVFGTHWGSTFGIHFWISISL